MHVLARRKWIILQAVILVPAAAVAYSLHQQDLFRASAEVLINAQSAVQSITGTPGLATGQDPQRFLDTQAALAREPIVAREVIAAVKPAGLTPDQFLANSSVAEKQGANLLVFSVTDHLKGRAVRLAAEYARQYVLFERKLDTSALQTALRKVRRRIAELGPRGQDSALYGNLLDKEQQLETALTLLTSTASIVRNPDTAAKVQPRPVRNGVLGLVLGVIVGLALALLRDALDSRVRTGDRIAAETGLKLLGRLPAPPQRLRKKNRLVMLADPFDPHAEAVRTLRTNIEFANLGIEARMIMITSAVEQEGKSTTAANLAVAFARGGDRVILVDLDLRRPFVHCFFDHESRPGITDVVLGKVELSDALFEVQIAGPGSSNSAYAAASRRAEAATSTRLQTLGVLPAGQLPPDPAEFVGTEALSETLAELARRADIVIVDSPPLLHVSDALALSKTVEGMIVVARIDLMRRTMLAELNRVLAVCPASKLGFVLTGAEHEEGFAYGYGDYYYGKRVRDQARSDEAFSP